MTDTITDVQEFMQFWEKKNNPFYPNEMRWDRVSINDMLRAYKEQLTNPARPMIKDFFPEGTTVIDVNKVYGESPELFKYCQELDNYIDEWLSPALLPSDHNPTVKELGWVKQKLDELIDKGYCYPSERERFLIVMNLILIQSPTVKDTVRSAVGEELVYWRQRCLAAEFFIHESPGDPDVTNNQIAAYNKWQEYKNQSAPIEVKGIDNEK